MVLKLLISICLIYGSLVAVLFFFQDSLVFPRHMVPAAPILPSTAQRVTLARPDGTVLHGVRLPGRDPARPIVMGFPGNGTNAETMALFLHQLLPAHDIVVYHYRGYAPSDGTPSASALTEDALAIHDSLNGPVAAIGFSIGSGVAAELAGARVLDRVILSTPFDSLQRVAQDSLPFLPVRWLFRHSMQPESTLATNTAPVTLFIATKDKVIAPKRAEALAATLPDATTYRLDAGHNDIYSHPDFAPALRQALR